MNLLGRTTTVYNLAGEAVALINPLGYRNSTTYDAAGRVSAKLIRWVLVRRPRTMPRAKPSAGSIRSIASVWRSTTAPAENRRRLTPR